MIFICPPMIETHLDRFFANACSTPAPSGPMGADIIPAFINPGWYLRYTAYNEYICSCIDASLPSGDLRFFLLLCGSGTRPDSVPSRPLLLSKPSSPALPSAFDCLDSCDALILGCDRCLGSVDASFFPEAFVWTLVFAEAATSAT